MPQLVNLRSAAHPELLGLLRHLPEEQLTSLQRLREGEGGHCPTKMPFLSAAQARTSRKLIHQILLFKNRTILGKCRVARAMQIFRTVSQRECVTKQE